MADRTATFGRLVNQTSTVNEFLALETQHRRHEQFAVLDALVGTLLTKSLRGGRILSLERGRDAVTVDILGLDKTQRNFIDDRFTLAQQQARGAWFLPEDAMVEVGWGNLPAYFADSSLFATGFASAERGKVRLHNSADALLIWAVLDPLFTDLYRPLALRGPLLGKKDRAWQVATWQDIDDWLVATGFDVGEELALLRYGGGWSKLDANAQTLAKKKFLAALADQVSASQASAYRALRVQSLVSRYYEKMKREPPALRQVLTKDLRRVLAGYFDGDWLAFLTYVEELPHPDERIATALPEPRLVVTDRDRISAVAAAQGVPVEEVERALRAFWGTVQETSPVEARVKALRSFWQEFDAIHARQQPGMPPLWGLVVEEFGLFGLPPYQPGLHRRLLSLNLLTDVERLWGQSMLPRWPEHVVSSISPHSLMSDTLGPALRFWHGCALTAWFICEGPSSRTDLPGLTGYFRNELAELASLGCPVDSRLFEELMQAERRLGPIESISSPTTSEIAPGVWVSISMSYGSRRTGFELLRDIISRYRRAWANEFLDTYFQARWETEIRDAARDFGLLLERKGHPPTAKQFASHAAVATNNWFGGDISGLYGMIGEKAPIHPVRVAILPTDREAFAHAVLENLKRDLHIPSKSMTEPYSPEWQEQQRIQLNLTYLAERSLELVQQEEARGRPLTLTEFGQDRFEYRMSGVTTQTEMAWACFQAAIEDAKVPGQRSEKSQDAIFAPGLPVPEMTNARVEAEVEELTTCDVPGNAKPRAWWRRLLNRT